MTSRFVWVGLLATTTGGAAACTKPNPAYCDEDTPCVTGTCNLDTHVCGDPPDGGVDGSGPDATGPCALAGGSIVFVTNRDGGGTQIARMLADGTAFQRLTTTPGNLEPRWSPDGSAIAWYAAGLWVMNADGSGALDVSAGQVSTSITEPRWSPDGTQLTFTSSRDGNNEVYRVNADGSDLTNLTSNASSDQYGDWSSDGERIVFSTGRDGNSEVYVMNADGGGQTRLTTNTELDSGARWSPTGAKIAYVSTTTGLWVMNPNGTAQTMLAPAPVSSIEWSPDGSRIAFSSGGDIFTVGTDGAALTNLTNDMGAVVNGLPRWSPDGSHLLFQTDRDGNAEVYSMTATGGQPTNLTNADGVDIPGAWSACPGP